MPHAWIAREANEFFFRSDGRPGKAVLLNEAPIVGCDKEGGLMTACGHPLCEPQQWIHIALAPKWHKENTERHVS